MHKFVAILLLASSMIFLCPVSSNAQEQVDVRPLLTQVRALVRDGDYDQARALLRGAGGSLIDQSFLEAEILVAEGEIEEAIKILRAMVAFAPNFESPRTFLAELLASNGQFDNARFHYEVLRRTTPNPQRRQFYTSQIANIDNFQPFGVSLRMNIRPNSNINGAEENGEIVNPFTGVTTKKPEELRPQFGWQGSVTGSAYARARIADQQELSVTVSATLNRYTYETLDNENVRVQGQYKFQDADSTVRLGPFFLRSWGDGEVYSTVVGRGGSDAEAKIDKVDEDYNSVGWSFFASEIINERLRAEVNLLFSHTEYDDDYYDYRENYRRRASAAINYAINHKNILGVSLTAERYEEAGGRGDFNSHNSYGGYTVGTSLSSSYANQWRTEIGASYSWRDYAGLYPALVNTTRWDRIYRVSAGIQNGNWEVGGFVPRMDCSYEYRVSNIKAFNTNSSSCGLSLTTDF